MWCSPGKPSSNRGSTGHTFIPHLADYCLTHQELLSSPSWNFTEHQLCFPGLEFGAVLSHKHFLPPVTALAALCTTVNWTQGHYKAEARIYSSHFSASEQENQGINLYLSCSSSSSGGTQICQAHELRMAPSQDPQPSFAGALAQCDTLNQHLKSLQSDFQLSSDKAESSTSPTKLLLQKEEERLN